MESYVINGGNRLEGEILLQGSKSACIPILAACLLNKNENIIHNVPNVGEVNDFLKILRRLGCTIDFKSNTAVVNSSKLACVDVNENIMGNMSSSIILLGALLAVGKQVKLSCSSGCDINQSLIESHIQSLKKLGFAISESNGCIIAEGNTLLGTNIMLDYPTAEVTENLMLASVFVKGVTCITNAARDPEITDLQNFLNFMGARVYGAGTSSVYIEGVSSLSSCEYTLMPDRMAAVVYMCATHVSGGKVFIKNCNSNHIKLPCHKLCESGLKIKKDFDGVLCESDSLPKAVESVVAAPYPAFPSDLLPAIISTLCYAYDGVSVVYESLFENNLFFVSQLKRMGANIKTQGRMAVVNCSRKLSGAPIYAHDLNSGAALIVASLGAQGQTLLNKSERLCAGFENISGVLKSLGADIKEEDEKIQKKKKE